MFTPSGVSLGLAQVDPNDPWPMFCHDARHTCRSPHRGPHAAPQLRWWADLGEGAPEVLRGAAIAYIGDTRYVIVGDNGTGVKVFRFHPDGDYDPELGPASPAWNLAVDLHVESTPLVLANDCIVLQTQSSLESWWLLPDGQSMLRWRTTADMGSTCASPVWALVSAADGAPQRLFVIGSGKLQALCEVTTEQESMQVNVDWSATLMPDGNNGYSTPAVGPTVGDPGARNFVYAAAWATDSGEQAHFFAVYADGIPREDPVAWKHGINDCGQIKNGTLASPSVIASGHAVVPSDDGAVYGFENVIPDPPPPPDPPLTWGVDVYSCCSGTGGLTAADELLFWSEDGSVYLWPYKANTPRSKGQLALRTTWSFGAPVIDDFGRWFVATPAPLQSPLEPQEGQVIKLKEVLVEPPPPEQPYRVLVPDWMYPGTANIPQARRGYNAPLALDEDGTLICVNDRYIVALRPPLGDFSGDGVCNNQDISPFILALLNESQWQASYGGVYGINLIGVGDCNNSGAFNNGDIDCMIDLLFGQDGPMTDEDWLAWAELMWLRCYLDGEDCS